MNIRPIGEVLQDAGLISEAQIKLALRDQQYRQDLKIGEILALRGWIEQNTVDFFVREWYKITSNHVEHPIGFYLKKAGILSEQDIKAILIEQKNTSLRFGEAAVKKGLVQHKTIDFFLQNLCPLQSKNIERGIIMNNANVTIVDDENLTYWVVKNNH